MLIYAERPKQFFSIQINFKAAGDEKLEKLDYWRKE